MEEDGTSPTALDKEGENVGDSGSNGSGDSGVGSGLRVQWCGGYGRFEGDREWVGVRETGFRMVKGVSTMKVYIFLSVGLCVR
ncbi:hypothetical protein PIB30_089615 [Stylosanthes scabra]|uniref:Uncharacterized protein n=1 Tax=Stylosanthes scabra TaxID=79078 RepID=A0ABU6VSH1_9FABA|nr:hypothetical protein [Stylosanthes scabra]